MNDLDLLFLVDENVKSYSPISHYDAEITCQASRIVKTDLFGTKNHLFFVLSKKENGKWVDIYKSEVVMDAGANPKWKPFKLNWTRLTDKSDLMTCIKFSCYDRASILHNSLLGSFEYSLVELIHRGKHGIPSQLISSDRRGRQLLTGLVALQFHIIKYVSPLGDDTVINTTRNIVLLGTGESGKSTFFKHVTIAGDELVDFNRTWKNTCLGNGLRLVAYLTQVMNEKHISLKDTKYQPLFDKLLHLDDNIFLKLDAVLDASMASDIQDMWYAELKSVWYKYRFSGYQGIHRSGHEMFLDKYVELFNAEYIDKSTILRSYCKTVGQIEYAVTRNNVKLNFIDT
jgi:hypothetical protein